MHRDSLYRFLCILGAGQRGNGRAALLLLGSLAQQEGPLGGPAMLREVRGALAQSDLEGFLEEGRGDWTLKEGRTMGKRV